jgi:hypothetical protein
LDESSARATRESTGVAGDTDKAPTEARRFLKVREGKAAAKGVQVLWSGHSIT